PHATPNLKSTLFPYTTLFRSKRIQGRWRRESFRVIRRLRSGRGTKTGFESLQGKLERDFREEEKTIIGSLRKMAADIWNHRWPRSEEHTSELQSQSNLVCRLL